MAGTTRSWRLPGGRLVMGISAACDHCLSDSRWSGTIVSFRPDGSDRTRLRLRHPGAVRHRLRQGHRGAPHVDEPARRPRRRRRPATGSHSYGKGRCGDSRAATARAGAPVRGVPAPLAVLDKHAAAGGVAIVDGRLGSAVGRAALVTEWERGQRAPRVAPPSRARGTRARARQAAHHRLRESASARGCAGRRTARRRLDAWHRLPDRARVT